MIGHATSSRSVQRVSGASGADAERTKRIWLDGDSPSLREASRAMIAGTALIHVTLKSSMSFQNPVR